MLHELKYQFFKKQITNFIQHLMNFIHLSISMKEVQSKKKIVKHSFTQLSAIHLDCVCTGAFSLSIYRERYEELLNLT